MTIDKSRLQDYFNLAWERHRIYVLKESGILKPWTENKIFQTNYFCNVFRRIDKTTVWIEDRIIKLHEHRHDLWMGIILARYISRISTLERLENLFFHRLDLFRALRQMQKDGEKIYTNAFVVNSKMPGGFTDKVTYMFKLINTIAREYPEYDKLLRHSQTTLEDTFDTLFGLPGVGNFMAYEYTTDLSYSKRYFVHAPDLRTWCAIGLGANRGLNRLLYGDPRRGKIKKEDGLKLCREIFELWQEHIGYNLSPQISKTQEILNNRWTHPDEPPAVGMLYHPWLQMTMREVEHWLCEYDKYMRGGSRKRRYPGV